MGESITDFGHTASRRDTFRCFKMLVIIFHYIISDTKVKEDLVSLFYQLKKKETSKEDESPARIATGGRMLILKFF